ncbi:putative inhibitor of apoptosis isoform X3 [Mercenaria mercenaria]|uniref:putative inhibitor of apoptosis isoform X3 n=1 Tax=Mercenaria mercenaria TaxID=6596 RepID=UPI00234EB98C|nr:putative inhibitor of apoptosis isoform X3 [Mercenaria mercenaria]
MILYQILCSKEFLNKRMAEDMTAAIVNKNAVVRLSQEQRTNARDKTHEQRKPKKKRKKIGEDTKQVISAETNGDWSVKNKVTDDKNKECHRSRLERQSYLTNTLVLTEGIKSIKSFGKILQPRGEPRSVSVLQPVIQIKIPKEVTCYPLTGASYSKPLIPQDDISIPTQVSESQESNTNEIVFSNGRSIKVEHTTNGNTSSEQNSSNVGAGFGGNPRHLSHHQTQCENYVQFNSDRNNLQRRPPRPPRHPEYTEYDQRLKSFARWWKQHPDPTTLCNAGFFFTNEADLVRCYQCGIGLKDFSYGDNPLNEHVKHSGECSYLQEYLGQERLAIIKSQIQTQDQELNYQKPSNTLTTEYRHPEYKSYHVRLSSFSRWPQSLMQRPEQLAKAGLYYTGLEDTVRCFACDGGLRKWDPEDDPWIEHCRWFPECPFVRKEKGEDYIGLVQATSAMHIQERLGNKDAPSNETFSNDLTGNLERLTLEDPDLNAVIDEHRETCLEMGYSEKDFNIAVTKLAKNGNVRPTLEDILDSIEDAEQIESQTELHKNETPREENVRLKSMLFCMTCGINAVNALFLPCTHHRMCMDCAKQVSQCPVCDRNIRQKIKTYLV